MTPSKRKTRHSLLQNPAGNRVKTFNTRFSLPCFIKRVKKLTDCQKDAINRTGFRSLLLIPDLMLSRTLLIELMERWDYDKCVFVLPPSDITICLLDVALILGLRVKGNLVILQEDTPFLELERQYSVPLWKRQITVAALEQRLDSLSDNNNEDFVRTFLLFMFGTFLFPNASGTVDSRYLYFLQDLDQVNNFAWGAAVLTDVFQWLHKRKKERKQCIGGCLIFLQIWCFEHIDVARPRLLDRCSKFPRVCNWGSTKSQQKPLSTKFKELRSNQIIWSLEPTSVESNIDIIKELIEAEKRKTWSDMNQQSSTHTSSHSDHSVKTGYQLMVDLEMESETETSRVAYGMQNHSSACCFGGKEKEHTRNSGADGTIVIDSDDDWEDDTVNLKKKIGELTLLSVKLEEENEKLRKEGDSSNYLVSRLERIVLEETLEHENHL